MAEHNTTQAPVIFEEIQTPSGLKIGHATLSKAKALNALNLTMIELLTPKLQQWQDDPDIAMVLLDGSGDRAFCAGGDIVSMYHSMQSAKAGEYSLLDFFSQEYRLDHLIHTYNKPLMVWGNGIVMGGGLGLMNGASHRIVTESSRIAMPEISIGLYPDVGGSHFLNTMPAGCGLFLGLTGASINATDALYVGLADHAVSDESRSNLIEGLGALSWQSSSVQNHQILTEFCGSLELKYEVLLPAGNMQDRQNWLTELSHLETLPEAIEYILSDRNEQFSHTDKWFNKAQKTLAAGSTITAHLVFEQLKRGKIMTLAECFKMELSVSCKGGELGEFQEGIRALLIDKDHQPDWLYKKIEDVPSEMIGDFFRSIWPAESHPLKDLT